MDVQMFGEYTTAVATTQGLTLLQQLWYIVFEELIAVLKEEIKLQLTATTSFPEAITCCQATVMKPVQCI